MTVSLEKRNAQYSMMSSYNPPFQNLPREINSQILSYLSDQQLAVTTLVSTAFYQFWTEKLIQRFNKKKQYKKYTPKYTLRHFFHFINNNGLKIKYLNLFNITTLNDQRLKQIIKNCPHLIGLRINSKQVTDKSLILLQNLKYLQCLNLYECLGITKKGIFSLKKIKKIDHLYLCRSLVTDEKLDFLTTIQTIKKLVLTDNQEISSIALSSLLKLPNLKGLALDNNGDSLLNQNSLNLIGQLTTLEKLDLLYLKSHEHNLTPLTKLPKLHNLYLLFCELKSESLFCIGKIENLRTLFLNYCKGCQVNKEKLDFSSFLNLKKLEELELIRFPVYEIDFIFLTQLENLKSLYFYRCSFTEATLSKIVAFTKIYDKGKSNLSISYYECSVDLMSV